MLEVRAVSFLSANPDLLQQVIEVDAIIHRNALVDGQVPVSQLDFAIRLLRDFRIVCHHQDRVAGAVQLAEQRNHDFLIRFVQVARRLIGKNHFRLIDQRPRNRHALLLPTRKLRWQVR